MGREGDLEKARAWISSIILPAFAISVTIIGAYWATVGKIEANVTDVSKSLSDRMTRIELSIVESAANRKELFSRVEKIEDATSVCVMTSVRSTMSEKAVEHLQGKINELETRLREHDEATRRYPIGKRSDIGPPQFFGGPKLN